MEGLAPMPPVLKVIAAVFLVVVVAVSGPGQLVSAQTHHVVGGEEGWTSASNISSWLSGRAFRVGDKLCKNLTHLSDLNKELSIYLCEIKENTFF